jgi:O-glycosyl hydrolase
MQRRPDDNAAATLRVLVTARDTGERLAERPAVVWGEDTKGIENSILNVYDDVEYQEIIGFGGAFTESAAVTFDKLPPAVRRQTLEACFDPVRGNRYTFCRAHMNSCDFSTGNYACCDKPGDVALQSFHWYSGDHFEAIEAVHRRWPGKGLVFTEGCVEMHAQRGPWGNAERYGHDILGDLNHFTQAWCDWNLLLDEQGGPNHVNNFCEAPLMGHTAEGRLDIKPSFYYIGHFSRFILPGSRRIAITRFTDRLECTAARTPDGAIVAIVLNRGDEPVKFALRHRDRIAPLESPAHSILTALW